jgi:serine/threonine protein kinase
VLKLFDFGLARELKESERTANGLYNLTGFTGAVRYMAPEVGLGKPYNEKSDVYSWSMLMWYMLALEPPFGMYSEDMLADRVFKGRERPQVFKRWPAAVSKLMKKAWHEDIAERPSFQKIRRVLKQELSPTAVLQESLTGIAG